MTEQRPFDRLPAPIGKQPEPAYPARRPGRPSGLTPQVEAMYFAARRLGNSRADSARYAGISPDTVDKWVKRAKGRDKNRPPNAETIRFLRMDEQAVSAVRVYMVGQLVARAPHDTMAIIQWLRRYGGSEWTEEDEVPAGPAGDTTIQQNNLVVVLPRDAIPETVHALLEARRSEMEAAEPINVTPAPEMPRRYGNSRTARAGLRDDADADIEDDDSD